MCCHYTTAAVFKELTSSSVYSAFLSIAIHFIGLHVLNAILVGSGDKWRRAKRKPAYIITMKAGSCSQFHSATSRPGCLRNIAPRQTNVSQSPLAWRKIQRHVAMVSASVMWSPAFSPEVLSSESHDAVQGFPPSLVRVPLAVRPP